MNRLFGNSASKKPKPNLQDAINAVIFQTFTLPTPTQTNSRISSIEIKIYKLDGELLSYKDQLSKLCTNSPNYVPTPRPNKLSNNATSASSKKKNNAKPRRSTWRAPSSITIPFHEWRFLSTLREGGCFRGWNQQGEWFSSG